MQPLARAESRACFPSTTTISPVTCNACRSPSGAAYAVTLQPDGKIVVAGAKGNGLDDSSDRFAVARFTPAGVLDATFGASGTTITPIGSGAAASAVIVQPDGKIVVAGGATTTEDDFAVARYWGGAVAPWAVERLGCSGGLK